MSSLKIEDFLRAEHSREGLNKKQGLNRVGIIAPCFRRPGPVQRISWEFIVDHVRSRKEQKVATMKSAKQNAVAGYAFERIETVGAVELFAERIRRMFGVLLEDFNPEHGFDLDMYLLVNSAQDMAMNRILMEIYPRRRYGRIEMAFCTAQPMIAPFAFEDDQALRTLVFAEAVAAGESIDSIHRRWTMHRGIWHLREMKTINLFLEHCCLGAVFDSGGHYVKGGYTTTAAGDVVQAQLDLHPKIIVR